MLYRGLDRGKTVAEPLAWSRLGLPLSKSRFPQVVEKLESGVKLKELLERVVMRPRQVRGTQASLFHVATFRKHHALVSVSARWIQPGKDLSGPIRTR